MQRKKGIETKTKSDKEREEERETRKEGKI